MSKIVNLKTCAKTLVMLSVIAAPVAQAVAQANKVPAEVIARRLANKKAKQHRLLRRRQRLRAFSSTATCCQAKNATRVSTSSQATMRRA